MRTEATVFIRDFEEGDKQKFLQPANTDKVINTAELADLTNIAEGESVTDENNSLYKKINGELIPVGAKGEKGNTGASGTKGDIGNTGATGASGEGVPTGGITGQHLAKVSNTDFDTEWVTPVSGDGFTYIYKSSNQSKTNDNTLTNDSELLFTTVANTTYLIKWGVSFSQSATPDIKFKLNHTGTTSSSVIFKYTLLNTSGITNAILTDLTTVITSLAGSSFGRFESDSLRLVVGASGGTFSIQWAQNTSDANPSTVFELSYLAYKVL